MKIVAPYEGIDYSSITATEENNLMIACKNECMRIINLIVDFDVNISLQIMNKIFYDFELPAREMKI